MKDIIKFIITVLGLVLTYLFGSVLVGSCSSGDEQYAIAPLVAAALVTGGASLLGNALGMKNQSDTNKANLALAREQNEWNEMMWNKTNDYNSPMNQTKLLRDAGINPLTAFANGTDGITASNVESADLANQKPFAPDFSGVGQIGDYMMQAKEYEIREKQLQLERDRLNNEIRKTDSEIGYIDAQTDSLKLGTEIRRELKPEEIRRYKEETDLITENIKKTQEDVKLAQAQAGYITEQTITEKEMREPRIQQILKQNKYYDSMTEVNKKTCQEITQRIANMMLDEKIKEVEFEIADKTKNYTVKVRENAAAQSGYDLEITRNESSMSRLKLDIQRERQGSDEFLAPFNSFLEPIGQVVGMGCQIATTSARSKFYTGVGQNGGAGALWKAPAGSYSANPSPMSSGTIYDISQKSGVNPPTFIYK